MSRPELMRLLQACKEAPDDDHARLVLADWLEEHGDENDRARADFVRLQVESGLEKGRPGFFCSHERMWSKRKAAWAPFTAALKKKSRPQSIRGLLSVSTTPTAAYSPEGQRWAGSEEWAWVERLTASPKSGELVTLLVSSLLDTVGTMCLSAATLKVEDMEQLAFSFRPSWGALWLRGCSLSGFLHLPRTSQAAGLRSLRLEGSRVANRDVEALGKPGVFPRLEDLELPGTMAPVNPWPDVLTQPVWRLKSLTVSGAHRDLPLLRAVAGGGCCVGLRRLNLRRWSGIDYSVLASAAFWPTLEELYLENCTLTPEDARRLALCKGTPSLRRLSFYGVPLLPESVRTLAASPQLASLTYLAFREETFGPGGAEALLALPAGPLALDLYRCDLGDVGLGWLACWPGLSRCRVLHLGSNYVTDEGIRALAESPHASGLVGLGLDNNNITDAGLAALLAADWVHNLEELRLAGNRLTRVSEAALIAAPLRAIKELALGPLACTDAVRDHFSHVPHVE
jgi:uncharacterized protein (TIGR02996 family)